MKNLIIKRIAIIGLVVVLFSSGSLWSQNTKGAKGIRYQGELFSGYTLGIGKNTGTWVYDRVPVHLLNGININGSVFLGIGVGVNAWGNWSSKTAIDEAQLTIPLYFNFKWYIPGGDRLFKFYLGADIGGVIQDKAEIGALLIGPSLGVRIRLYRSLGLTIGVGYQYEGWVLGMEKATSLMINTHAIAFKAGITF